MKINVPFRVPFEITKTGTSQEGDWVLEGFCATSDLDLQGDVITEAALKGSANDLLENSTVLFNHDQDKPIGKTVETKVMKIDGTLGLWVKVVISKTDPNLWTQIKEGVLNKFSIRGKVLRAKKEFVAALGRMANVIYKMKLIENSIVSLPANPKARALRWYVSKALADFESEGGSLEMNILEVLLKLLGETEEIKELAARFEKYCETNNVEIEKSTDEELTAVFVEFHKEEIQKGTRVEVLAAIDKTATAMSTLAEKLPDELKETGQAVTDAIKAAKAIATSMPATPYPAPAAKDTEEDDKGEDDKDKNVDNKDDPNADADKTSKSKGVLGLLLEFIQGKAKEAEKTDGEFDLEKFKDEMGAFLEEKANEDNAATQKSIDDLGVNIVKDMGKALEGLTKTFTDKIEDVSKTLTGAIEKSGADIVTLSDKVKSLEEKVPGAGEDNDTQLEAEKGVFGGVFGKGNVKGARSTEKK